MQSDAEAHDNKIRSYLEQLYQDERLTVSLADQAARILLKWGEARLKALAELNVDQVALDRATQQLRSIMHSINNLAGLRWDLAEGELVAGLIELVEASLQYKDILSIQPQEPAHGEETWKISDFETEEG